LRDYEDCAGSYPGAVWPAQARRALRGMIRVWHAALDQGLPVIPGDVLTPLEHEFRHAVLAGLAHLSLAGPQLVTERAALWLVLEQGSGHLNDHVLAGCHQSMVIVTCADDQWRCPKPLPER
jgi:hypothetical protein